MEIEVGIQKEHHYLRDFLKYYGIQYQEFNTAQEMLASEAPVLFCDTEIDLVKAVSQGKFVITNHAVLMNTIGKQARAEEGYSYIMKDFVFGERSFYIDEQVYCCDPDMGDVEPKLQMFVKEQEFFDVGETFSPLNEKIAGACILAGRQIISLPWDLRGFDRFQRIELRPYYKKKSNQYAVRLMSNMNHHGFRQLLLTLLQYAFRRQEIWMPENHALNIRMGDQDIEFVYPPQKVLDQVKREKKRFNYIRNVIPVAFCLLLLISILYFASLKFAAVMLAVLIISCGFIYVCNQKRPSVMKYMIGLFALGVIGVNLLYNLRSLAGIYPLYHPDTQARYVEQFMEDGEYADALLQLLVKDKEIRVHDLGDPYEHPVYTYYEEGDPHVKYAVAHDPKYYYGRDYVRFFEEFAGSVSVDETLATKESFDFSVFRDESSMTRIGYSNDMARYTFLINQDEIEQASYFWYDYVYRGESETMYIYLENDISADDTSLVALWDTENNLYIMSREHYDREVSR